MIFRNFLALIMLLGALISSCTSIRNVEDKPQFHSILNSIENWEEVGDANWSFEKGVLSGKDGVGFMMTKRTYANFILEAQFMPDKSINSGIFIRCPQDEQSPMVCYEINIWDDHVNQEYRTGSIVTHGPPLEHINTVGKWNSYRIEASDDKIVVWLNGVKTADLVNNIASEGHIALQTNGSGTIKFKDVKIREL